MLFNWRGSAQSSFLWRFATASFLVCLVAPVAVGGCHLVSGRAACQTDSDCVTHRHCDLSEGEDQGVCKPGKRAVSNDASAADALHLDNPVAADVALADTQQNPDAGQADGTVLSDTWVADATVVVIDAGGADLELPDSRAADVVTSDVQIADAPIQDIRAPDSTIFDVGVGDAAVAEDSSRADAFAAEDGGVGCQQPDAGDPITIAEVRALGIAEFPPKQIGCARVTALNSSGYFIQKQREGPGIYVYTNGEHGLLERGDVINLTVSKTSEHFGMFEVVGGRIDQRYPEPGYDVVAELAQDITEVGPPDEQTEGELITISGASITGGHFYTGFTIGYGTTIDVTLWAPLAPLVPLCAGDELSFTAIATQYNTHQLAVYDLSDIQATPSAACQSFFSTDNWDFEEAILANGFDKTSELAVSRSSVHNIPSNHNAQLTWTAEQQALFPAHYQAVPPSGDFTCSLRVWDEDPNGSARLSFVLYNKYGSQIGYANYTESSDITDWQNIGHTMTLSESDNIKYIRCIIFLSGTASQQTTIWVDDLGMCPNGACEGSESCSTCPQDCGSC